MSLGAEGWGEMWTGGGKTGAGQETLQTVGTMLKDEAETLCLMVGGQGAATEQRHSSS